MPRKLLYEACSTPPCVRGQLLQGKAQAKIWSIVVWEHVMSTRDRFTTMDGAPHFSTT